MQDLILKELEERYGNQEKTYARAESRRRGGSVRYVLKALPRCGNNEDRGHKAVFQVAQEVQRAGEEATT